MRGGFLLSALFFVVISLLSGCASISSELTYKAISRGNGCRLDKFHWVWMDNKSLSLATSAQYRLIDQKPAFTGKEKIDGEIALNTIVGVFRTYYVNDSRQMARKAVSINAGLCYLEVTPIRAVHDVRGGDEVELEASVVNGAGGTVWLTRYKVRSTHSGMSIKMVNEFNDRLMSELRSDGYLN